MAGGTVRDPAGSCRCGSLRGWFAGVCPARRAAAQGKVVSFLGGSRWTLPQAQCSLLRDIAITNGETNPARAIKEEKVVAQMYWFGKGPYENGAKLRGALGNHPAGGPLRGTREGWMEEERCAIHERGFQQENLIVLR